MTEFHISKEIIVTKQLKLVISKYTRIVTHITAKFASEVSHRRFCYIYLA